DGRAIAAQRPAQRTFVHDGAIVRARLDLVAAAIGARVHAGPPRARGPCMVEGPPAPPRRNPEPVRARARGDYFFWPFAGRTGTVRAGCCAGVGAGTGFTGICGTDRDCSGIVERTEGFDSGPGADPSPVAMARSCRSAIARNHASSSSAVANR